MSDNNFEQRCAIKFCFRLGCNATETFAKLQLFGSLRHFQKEESQLKMNLKAESPHFQKPLKMSLESGILDVQPPFSPDLSPRDFFLFPKLKNHLKGHHFGTLENIQTAVTNQLKAIPISEFPQFYEEWKKRLQHYVAS
ncbi:uncharacterized protein TNCV_2331701 [Trichonephila clavipes]|nr:uncharacterized protein TNCV_2331701 [Trichonephila clavipes]